MSDGVEYLTYGTSFTEISNGGASIQALAATGGIDYRLGDLVLSGDLALIDLDGARFTRIDAGLAYNITPQALVYADLAYLDDDFGPGLTTYQIGGEFSTNGLTFGLLYLDSDESTIPATTAAYAGYQLGGSAEIIGLFGDSDGFQTQAIGLEYDDGTYDISVLFRDDEGESAFGIGAKYDFGNGFRALGNYTDVEIDGRWIAIGGGFEVAQDTWVDLSFGQVDYNGGGEVDTISLAISFDMGSQGRLLDRALNNQSNALGIYGTLNGY